VYELASYYSVETASSPDSAGGGEARRDAIAGLHSLYALAGFDQYYLVHATSASRTRTRLRSRRSAAIPGAQQKYGVDASYLAPSTSSRARTAEQRAVVGRREARCSPTRNVGQLRQGGNIWDRTTRSWPPPLPGPLRRAGDMRQASALQLDYDYVDAVEFFARGSAPTQHGWTPVLLEYIGLTRAKTPPTCGESESQSIPVGARRAKTPPTLWEVGIAKRFRVGLALSQ